MINQKHIETILITENAIEQLQSVALSLKKKGLSVQEIYNEFLKIHTNMNDLDEAKDLLGDFMDMITGYYVGKNIDLGTVQM